MFTRTFRLPLLVLAAVALAAGPAGAIGFQLGETKEQLKLEYDVAVTDHGTGRVTVVLTLADEGRLKPLDSVSLMIPAKEKNKDGGRWFDLSVALATREKDGKQVVRIHILREWAERAEIWLQTHRLDGKLDPMTGYYHSIPIAPYLKDAGQTKQ